MPARAEPHSPMLDTGAMLALAALGPRRPAVTLWANSGKACAGRNSLLKGAVGDVADWPRPHYPPLPLQVALRRGKDLRKTQGQEKRA